MEGFLEKQQALEPRTQVLFHDGVLVIGRTLIGARKDCQVALVGSLCTDSSIARKQREREEEE